MYESIYFQAFPYNYGNQAYKGFSADLPRFMKDTADTFVSNSKTANVKTQKMWSKVTAELTLDDVTSDLISKFKTRYGTAIRLEYNDDTIGRYFNAKLDTTRMPLGRLIQGDRAFTPPKTANVAEQSILSRRDSGKEFVIDGYGQSVSRYVYRFVNSSDVTSIKTHKALIPRSETAGNSILEHVGGQKKTRYISTTRSKRGIQNPHGDTFDSGQKVKIDLSYISRDRIYDLSTPLGEQKLRLSMGSGEPTGINKQALEDVKRTKEVLVEGRIPIDAIVATRGFELPDIINIALDQEFR